MTPIPTETTTPAPETSSVRTTTTTTVPETTTTTVPTTSSASGNNLVLRTKLGEKEGGKKNTTFQNLIPYNPFLF